MLREQQKPFLFTGWAKKPALAREGTEIFMAAVCICIINTCNTFRIVPTFDETFHCLLDVDDPVFAILIYIMTIVVLLKIREVVFKNGLNNISASGFIDRYRGVHTMFKQERQEGISFKR
jgi:hypothetical protein